MKTRVRPSTILTFGCGLSVLVYVLLVPAQERRMFAQSVQSEEAGAQETYVSEVIIEAPWAEENLYQYAGGEESTPGEFGMYEEFQEPEATGGLILGPNSFSVAPDGDIYINDPLNKRTQRFGSNGGFISVIPIVGGIMCVGEDNSLYATRASSPYWFIERYDQGGNLLASYPTDVGKKRISPTETETRQLQNIYCDNSGRLYAAFSHDHRRVDESSKRFIDSTWGGICQVGDASGAFSLEEQERTMREHAFLGCNSAALSVGYFRGEPGRVYLISFGGDTINTYSSVQGSFFGCDEDLSIYTTQWDRENGRTIVRKYNQESTLVSTFGYGCDKPYLVPAGRGQFVDSKGNVYVLCESYQDGIQITKWYKAD